MIVHTPGPSVTRAPKTENNIAESSQDLEAEANRRTGDVSIYLYYIGSIGWPTTLVFIFCITVFVFCTSFPSEYSPRVPYRNMLIHLSNLAQMVGHGGNGIPLRADELLPRYLRYAWLPCNYLPHCQYLAVDHHDGTKVRRELPYDVAQYGSKVCPAVPLFIGNMLTMSP